MPSNNNYHFKIGAFDCTIVNDGTFAYPHPAQSFFANAPQETLQQAMQRHNLIPEDWEVYISPYPSLVINTGQQLVLVDTGAGGIAPTTGKLLSHLQMADIAPEDIDTVILTHGHPDHIGGTLDATGQPAFPQARYVMGREEWDFWGAGPDLSHLPLPEELKGLILHLAQTNLPPLEDRLHLIEADTEILPGIRAVAAPGHTPGHLALSVTSEEEQLLVLGDAVTHPIHLEHPDWYAGFDYESTQVVATRHSLLNRAAEEKALVFAFHFPSPSLGYVVPRGQAWQWQPLER